MATMDMPLSSSLFCYIDVAEVGKVRVHDTLIGSACYWHRGCQALDEPSAFITEIHLADTSCDGIIHKMNCC